MQLAAITGLARVLAFLSLNVQAHKWMKSCVADRIPALHATAGVTKRAETKPVAVIHKYR